MKEATHLASLYRATAAALESVSSTEEAKTIEDILRDAKDQMTLEKGLLSYQISFHKLIDTMKREEQADVVFSSFQPRHRNRIEAAELEVGLKHLRITSKRDYPPGEDLVKVFATSRNGDLRREDFASVLDGLAALSRDCTFEVMCHLLLHYLVFSKSGGDMILETVTSIAGRSRFKIDDAITEARLLLLYKAMSNGTTEMVPVRDVLRALSPVIQKIGETERQLVLALRCWDLRQLDYELFSDHIMGAASCIPGCTVDGLIKEMTVAIYIGEPSVDDLIDFSNYNQFDSSSSCGSLDSFES
ncbi:hypothetical protein MHU86_4985 [Fragilaria crotonensis]|nr:hypothetical protein MHU86_10071 [Fragilaria crotonensis]KAI2509484.1 hypothetical protein MHU86_4985 [Fragilaria crotonensis]